MCGNGSEEPFHNMLGGDASHPYHDQLNQLREYEAQMEQIRNLEAKLEAGPIIINENSRSPSSHHSREERLVPEGDR